MKLSLITRCFIVAGFTAVASSSYAAGTWSDARNDAMGGTGVASSHYSSAALVNPALLTKFNGNDHVSLILPSVTATVSNPDKIEDKFDSVKNSWDGYKLATAFNTNTAASAQDLKNAFQDISGKGGSADAAASTAIAVPNAALPFAFTAKAWGVASAKATVTDNDLAYLDSVIAGRTPTTADLNSLTSRADGAGAIVTEYGISAAKSLTLAGKTVSVGMTPKLQQVYLYNYNVGINNYSSSDFRNGEFKNSQSGANVDLGFAMDLTPNWTVGLVGQNLMARSIDSKEVNGIKRTFEIRPQATVGTAWTNGTVTLATDVDLTPASGFSGEKKNQYVGIGAELNAWNWAQLRAGYRANMKDSDKSMITAGVGLSPFNLVHLDLTGMVGTSSNTYGAAAKLSFTF
ncbi:conjugal transfer protein TraF [Dickeya dianthicola]|uniref:conjugal transfer protein TraF n=1 Tax=Dickeya dianthicola TaxID=204039 RepID=UPI0003A050CB|nr:conjugal transfer protein TraF [Dickeya dianthicola]MCI4031494.1 conjugal transfer protein TraF [Dickeya dianthicola]MCI4174580.1 conjugal transfer protein TraF [Dickeya dianthicola]MCI4179560.1 conjugal transfer protein TraF [Dickeya dianthicola]MCI4180333.1 conjugal transfer protein TraF [Dickeya dianthicola]MCI4194068.1 conjugal transfer protein TraF [Dickeya dianthicola]